MSKIAVLGTGSWATALSRVLVDNQNEIMMYGIEQSQIDDINLNHQNQAFFKDVYLENEIQATNNLEEALKDMDYLLITIPTQYVKETLEKAQKNKFDIMVTALDTNNNIYNVEYKNKVIVIGNEANGVSKEIQDIANCKVKIPMLGKTESLNASVATGIIIYEYVRRVFK